MIEYNPTNWYWIIGDNTKEVFSSSVGTLVSTDDKTYNSWLEEGGIPTKIGTKFELGEVLAPYSIRPIDTDVLDGYRDLQSRKITLEVVAKVLLWLVNEVRTLKGQTTVTSNQLRSFIKELM